MIRLLFSLFRSESLRDRLLRGGLATATIRVGGVLMMLATSVVLARTLGVEGFGNYALAFSIMTIIAVPVHVGLPTLVLRETASSDAAGDLGRLKGIWVWATRQVLVLSVIVMTVAGLVWLLVPGLVTIELAVAFLLIPLIALAGLRVAAMKGLRCLALGMLPDNILRPGSLVLLVLAAGLAWPGPLRPEHAMGLNVVASVLTMVVGGWLLMRCRPAGLPQARADLSHGREWLSALVPMAMVGGLQVANQQAGTVILGAVATEADVAMYRVALSASSLILFGLQLATPPFEPYFVRHHQVKDHAGLQKIATASALAGFLLTLPVALIFIFGGQWLITLLYGDQFAGAYPALMILVAGQMLRVYFGSCETILMLTGQQRKGAAAWAFAAVLAVILATPLSMRFGAPGAAAAASIVLVVLRANQWLVVRRKLRVDTAIHSVIWKVKRGS